MAKLLPRSEELTVLRKDPDATVISPPPKSPNTPSEVSKRYQIQLGAFSSEDIARREWRRIEKLHPGLVSTLSPNLIPVERGYLRTTIYRLQAGPLGKSEAAQSLCAKFKSQGQDCFVVKHDTD